MRAFYDKQAAIVVMPPVRYGRLQSSSLRNFLARADLTEVGRVPELLPWTLSTLGRSLPETGVAALRLWGQTGVRPSGWVAAADPVYLEPQLDHLRIHALSQPAVPVSDLEPLVNHLEKTLGDGSPFGFTRVGSCVYIRATSPIGSAAQSPLGIEGHKPNDHLPSGPGADLHRGLVSEIEMALHEHPVNLERQRRRLPPINSLWIWGGGRAPEMAADPLPPLFSDDPLLKGYWASNDAYAAPWPGDFAACVDAAEGGFVATAPDSDDGESLEYWLQELRSTLGSRRLSSLVILFRDGVAARVRRSHSVRLWRRGSPLFDEVVHGA